MGPIFRRPPREFREYLRARAKPSTTAGQPSDSRVSNVEGTGDLARRFASIQPGERLTALLGVQRVSPPEFDAASEGAGAFVPRGRNITLDLLRLYVKHINGR